jgi:hypothetical protein
MDAVLGSQRAGQTVVERRNVFRRQFVTGNGPKRLVLQMNAERAFVQSHGVRTPVAAALHAFEPRFKIFARGENLDRLWRWSGYRNAGGKHLFKTLFDRLTAALTKQRANSILGWQKKSTQIFGERHYQIDGF